MYCVWHAEDGLYVFTGSISSIKVNYNRVVVRHPET